MKWACQDLVQNQRLAQAWALTEGELHQPIPIQEDADKSYRNFVLDPMWIGAHT